MRKIERQIIEKINLIIDIRKERGYFDDTLEVLSVRDSIKYSHKEDVIEYTLHASEIFRYYIAKDKIQFTFNGYDTQTTKQRLNVLLSFFCNIVVFKRNGKLYLKDANNNIININNTEVIESTETYEISRKSGIITRKLL